MRKFTRKRKKIFERIICFILVIELCLGGLPIPNNGWFSFFNSLTVHAADPDPFVSTNQLVAYSKNYTADNTNDTIRIVFSDSTTQGGLNEFEKIGKTPQEAFDGKIILLNTNIALNLPTAMFGYITDNVEIVDEANNPVELTFTRIYDREDQPLLADHVIHTRTGNTPVEWKLRYDRFMDPDNNNNIYVHNFAGYIGALEENAKVNISSIVLDNSNNDKVANIISNNDAGLVCCTMQTDSELTVGTITTGTYGNGNFYIQSKNGNAGGIVGSMASGSTLKLGSSITNPQSLGQNISADNGFSGGIVGKCEEGTIEFNNTAPYSLSQIINGKSGAGGICGYYKTKTSEKVTISSEKFTYNSYKVNGDGKCGGLFGELVNNGGIFTINGNSSVTADHSSGSASSLGGLIGSYSASALTDTLTIGTTGTVTPSKSGGSASNYGGAIGVAGKDSYVRINNLAVNASDAANFGGAVGNANGAFIDINVLTVTAAPAAGYSGAGVVNVLGNGVLRMDGAINLANAKANDGQIVNTRDYGLIFAESSWTLTRCPTVGHVDDVGSWGEVLRFGTLSQNDIFDSFTDGNHSVTLKPAVLFMTNTTDFVKTALNIQLNKTPADNDAHVLVCDSDSRSSDLLASTSLELNSNSVAVDLSGTGITGLTRDNGEHCVEFTGTFDGKNGSIKLAVGESYSGSGSDGTGKIYKHSHNGLFAKTKNATIQNLKISKDSSINVCADSAMYIGNVIAQASGNLTLSNIDVCHNTTDYATINAGGSTASSIGGLIGDIGNEENKPAGTVSITGCTYDGEIKGNITKSNIGGMIGSLKGGTVTLGSLGSSYVKGKITAASGNKVGGTIAVTNGSEITLKNLSVNGLNMTVSGDSGGFLGHEWLKTEAEFTGFTVNGIASLTSGATAASGLVQTASGYWKVNGSGIDLDASTSVTASSAASFGLLVNDGTKLYLELLPSAYTAGETMTFSLGNSLTVFDELVAYSASGDILSNGQGIVSIGTPGHALLKMGSYGSNEATYQHQTNYLGNYTGLYDNPNTRYYYNLDAYNTETPDSEVKKLLMWSVRQYAHEDIQKYFKYEGTSIGSSASTSLDMAGYSYYPVDLTDSLTLKGAVHLYNAEFDTTENSAVDKRLSTESGTQSQHYTIHNSLFRNVSGSLTFEGSLNGNVREIDSYCGALIMGNVGSDQPANPAKITINSLLLDGINIAAAAGPLLINTASSNSTFNISNVSNSTTKYTSKGEGVSTYIATSLLGNIGSSSADSVKLTFSGIKLDGRNNAGVSALPDLTSVYNSNGCLFSAATLVNKLEYAEASGSFGVYNYTHTEDWGGSPASRNVTYGAEIDNTRENRDNSSPSKSKQQKYNKEKGVAEYFTHPTSQSQASEYGHFAAYFKNYVAEAYVTGGTNHELRVNIPGNESTGCGTYNDPYIITSGTILTMFSKVINDTNTGNQTISVPKKVVDGTSTNETWCENKSDHYTFTTYDASSQQWSTADSTKTIANDKLREYLAGAYYKLDETAAIELLPGDQGFQGFSNNITDPKYVFRGVIDGSGNTVVNRSSHPLIVSSNGSVVYKLVLDVQPSSPKTLTQSAPKPFIAVGADNTDRCEFYGAVMGQILGGDNIIDDVDVKFTGPIVSKGIADRANIVPIGGYVGVVVNGGLIFRNMKGGAVNNQGGISAANLTGFTDGTGTVTSSDNTKWLYINPIIGRVLNGYAVTESDSYKPFEDGSRTYPDGSTEYWQADGSVGTSASTAKHVTMQNGTKNYSIADINPELPDFTVTAPSGSHPGAEGSKITVPNAQSLFIISLITESGLGTSANGKYDDTNNILQPYTDYMTTHLAGYHYVGNSNLPAAKPTAKANPAVSESQKGANDYCDASGDISNDTENNSTKVPYLIKNYTPYGDETYPYPAFNLAAFESGKNELYLKMEFSSSGDTTYYMPDGFRGLGANLLQNSESARYLTTTTNYSGLTNWANNDTDNSSETRIFNAMFLSELTGNNRNVSLNMSLLLYSDDNYLTPTRYQAFLKTGYGFFNALRSTGGSSSSNKIKDLTIKGSVYYDLFKTSGEHVVYDSSALNVNYIPATSAFIGAPGVDTNTDGGGGDMWLENIVLNNVTVTGVESVGGFMGCSNAERKYTFYECGAENLEVVGGTAVGGMMGYIRNIKSIIDADFNGKEFGIISIRARSKWAGGSNNHAINSVGGLFGENFANNNTGITVKNVTIRNAESVNKGYVGHDPDPIYNNAKIPSAGGVLGGVFRSSRMTLTNVTVSNIDVKGAKAGGMIGNIEGNYGTTISDSQVTASENCVIESTYTDDKDDKSSSGGFIGTNNAKQTVTVSNSQLYGYTIIGADNVGGITGYFGSSNSGSSYKTILKNIELSGHTLKGYKDVGGLIGSIAESNDRELLGYNIRINDQKSEYYSGSGSITNNGYIVGNNGSNSNKLIKIVGFSRQGTIDTDRMVGNLGATNAKRYGTGGYVIFADYNDTAARDKNEKFANMQVSGINIGAEGDHTNVSTKTYKYKVENGSIVGDKIDPTDPVPGSPLAYDSSLGLDPVSTYSGIKYEYVPYDVLESELVQVASLSDLEDDNDGRGFYLYNVKQTKYMGKKTNSADVFDISDNHCVYVNNYANAVIWHFLKVGTNEYKIYTTIGNNNYIKYVSNNFLYPTTNIDEASVLVVSDAEAENSIFNSTQPDNLKITEPSSGFYHNSFYFNVKNTSYWMSMSGTRGIRFWKQHLDTSEISTNYQSTQNQTFKIKKVPSSVKLQASVYSSITINNSTITPVGTPTSTRDATAEEIAAYTAKCGSSTTAVLYDITETIKQNSFSDIDNSSPYVTTNPKAVVTKNDDTPLQWLTSDGVSKGSYNGSAAYNIITAIKNGSDKKRYQNTGLSADDITQMDKRLYDNMTTIKKAGTRSDPYNGEDFPVLVVNDISTAHDAVNGYLQLLTNTSYNFACGYKSEGSNPTDSAIYNVEISKWLYNNTTGKFEKQPDEASLKCLTNTNFRINANDLDNGKWQISLVDVQFFDPTVTGRIAYHLYVPVVVKKMLFYTVDLKAASTTTYKLDAYPTQVQNILENLGNPITLRLTYTYQQTAQTWEKAINNGENVYRNYNKNLDIVNFTRNFPADSQIVLLDPNNNIDKFYNGSFSTDAANGGVIRYLTGTSYKMDFESFTDPTDSNTQTNKFKPVKLNDLMNITVDENATTKNLVECNANDPEIITVVRNYRYPDPQHEGEYLTKDLYLRYKHDNEDGSYAVNVALKENQNDGQYVQEHYYISIFTKSAPYDKSIYHYEIETFDKTLNDPDYPSALKGNVDAPHLFLGNLYNNSVTIQETNLTSKMDASNNTLSANLNANIGFTQQAIDNGIIGLIEANENVKIYQTFMISLDRQNGEAGNQRGIIVDPISVVPQNYKINNDEPENYSLSYVITKNYIELHNDCNIKDALVAKAKAAKETENPTENDYKITISESASWTYAANTLPDQFPKSSPETPQIGTYMIGYSNISATSNGGSASHESKNTEDTSATRIRYYVDDDTTVEFSYNAISNPKFVNDGNGNYGQLGINGREVDEENSQFVPINTAAYYNAQDYNMKNRAHYIKIMIQLSKKSDYNQALDIPTYLKDFELYNNDGEPIVILDTNDSEHPENAAINAANDYSIDLTNSSKIYTYIIPKEKVEISDDVYSIPIKFKAYSGNNSSFETKTGTPAPDMQYSNYKVQVTAGLLETKNGDWLQNSNKTKHIIYTNAKIYSDIIQ